ncbi:hypothetical protein FOCC_FOCC006240 [Frankliniella occidentalis]|nr:hypothetical protein FOCC_FOCC006240 [Frankliniella occidentalis]
MLFFLSFFFFFLPTVLDVSSASAVTRVSDSPHTESLDVSTISLMYFDTKETSTSPHVTLFLLLLEVDKSPASRRVSFNTVEESHSITLSSSFLFFFFFFFFLMVLSGLILSLIGSFVSVTTPLVVSSGIQIFLEQSSVSKPAIFLFRSSNFCLKYSLILPRAMVVIPNVVTRFCSIGGPTSGVTTGPVEAGVDV